MRGRDIKRYVYEWAGKWVINTHNGYKDEDITISPINIKDYPRLKLHLDSFWSEISKRSDKGHTPYNLRHCAYMSEFNRQKIVWAEMTKDPSFIYNNDGIFINQTCYFIPNANKYHLAILNSKLIYFYMQLIASSLGEGAFRWIKQYIEKIPIPKINEKNQNIVDKIISLTDEILTLKEQNMDSDISEFDLQINRLVYELYELSEEEIAFVES
ncbi:TaqI-like C-terminal specificity domain-containing protein [Helicobacter cappadocius]|uniref:site-specific DNA-methyltransferase (adenine-specific) n=1 Tax=Helicobacter cappadocius TaxID=3063998 RepID=A0ABT8Z8D3_9HELI|nr:TaqI-like C-terminal specificity domain-containing protein [Helicobacter sp. faydin-H75]MDO7253959.1 TaqI-like C-terminal specificity domain-containing protein [Helicobacter sp. faydin-H75]